MRASGFPESVCVAVPLHRVCATACVCTCANACFCFHLLCVFVWEGDNESDSERVCGWLLGFTSLELVHYSLTVLPSEIPGSGCVTHKHTHTCNTQTHTNRRNAHIHSSSIPDWSLLCILVLYWVTSSKSGLLSPRGRDRRREREIPTGYRTKPLSHFIFVRQL